MDRLLRECFFSRYTYSVSAVDVPDVNYRKQKDVNYASVRTNSHIKIKTWQIKRYFDGVFYLPTVCSFWLDSF